ncbi:MAG: apolipoprotein N-acyltransferase [Verrucomicrobiae bacterium]|nr:apolipoprotein N-acyltransferase [Verrucomicrobiae bacterium]
MPEPVSVPVAVPSPRAPRWGTPAWWAGSFGLPACAGVVLALAYPPFDAFQLGWVGLIPLLWAVESVPPGEAFRRGYLAGLFFFGLTVWWVGHVTVPGAVTLIILLALYFGAAGWWLGLVGRYFFRNGHDRAGRNLLAALVAAAGWVVIEWFRARFIMGGFGWNGLGVSQYRAAALLQFISVTGGYGASALLVVINVIFYATVRRWLMHLRAGQPVRRLSWELYAVMVTVCVLFLVGAREIARRDQTPSQSLRVLMVQANIPQSLKFVPDKAQMILDRHRHLTLTGAASQPNLIIWPETALPHPMRYDPVSYELATNIAITTGTYLLTGTIDYRSGSYPPEAYNAAILLGPDGTTRQIYHKIHLVPFGEYVPFQRWTRGLLKLIGPEGYDITEGFGFHRGREWTVFTLWEPVELRFASVICFEDTVPHLYRQFARQDVHFLVNLTNDAWFRESPAAAQHLANAVFRAIETRRPLLRATNNGITSIVDQCGVVRAELAPFTEGALTATINIPLEPPTTFYMRHGDVFVAVCALVAFLWFATANCFRLRSQSAQDDRHTHS